jgi:flavodoxin
MKIAIVYASNSGGTFLIAKQIAAVLQSRHEVTIKKAAVTAPAELLRYDFVLFGSSTWNVDGVDGMPLKGMLTLLKRIQAHKLAPKRYAIFGCGEESFMYFCGAVDVIDKYLRVLHGKAAMSPLKINEYFFRLQESEKLVADWAEKLISELKKYIY